MRATGNIPENAPRLRSRRVADLSGRIPKRLYATATSPGRRHDRPQAAIAPFK